jgi:hypothetical protein
MWLPPSTWIYAAASGANAARSLNTTTAEARGQTTKIVRCEACRQHYAYQLTRTGHGAVDGTSGNAYSAALLRAEADLQHLLAIGIEPVPCPACGWYQSNMIPQVRSLHRRWMVYVGQCLTIGLIPVAVIGLLINRFPEGQGTPPIPWPIFVAGLVSCLAAGIGMFIGRPLLAKMFNPNDEDVEAHKRYGQSCAILLSDQEANDVLAQGRLPDTGTMDIVSNGPHGNELQPPSYLGVCVALVLLIVVGICCFYWNYW